MSSYWSPVVKQLTPYVPGEQPQIENLVKLNTNENPYGPSPRVIEALGAALDDNLRLYPDPSAARLRATIARYYGLEEDWVFIGNGSDEVLAHAFCAFFQHARPLLFPDISYSFYPVYCDLYGIDYRTIPLADDLSLRLEDYDQPNGGIIFPNPNAPTGRLVSLDDIKALVSKNRDSVVVVDEAYIDFGGESAAKLAQRHDNLLVVQTLSKSRSLAGMRVGFALGHVKLIEALIRVKDSFNSYPIDRLAQIAGIASFEDEEYFRRTCRKVMESRERLTGALVKLGFEIPPSAANFIFARHPAHDAERLAASLRKSGIVVRHFRQPRIEQYLRITIGTPQQNQRLIEALKALV